MPEVPLGKHIPNARAQAQLTTDYGEPEPAPDWLGSVPNISKLL